jgi:3-methyladenine DNA glycosylase Tag
MPKNLAGYLDSMTHRVFQAGMSWDVVDAKWSGIEEAFHGFDPAWVAHMSPDDVDHVANDPKVIRNRRKIEATVGNARTMLDLDRTHRGFRRYLRSLPDYDALSKDLQRHFHFLGESRGLELSLVGRRSRAALP